RQVLAIAVEREGVREAGCEEPDETAPERRALAAVLAVAEDFGARGTRDLRGRVARAVVHDEDVLDVLPGAVDDRGDRRLEVEAGDGRRDTNAPRRQRPRDRLHSRYASAVSRAAAMRPAMRSRTCSARRWRASSNSPLVGIGGSTSTTTVPGTIERYLPG